MYLASKYRVKNIRIFGSQARGEETADSDVDFLVEFEEPNLLDRIGFKQDLEELLNMPVDVVTESTIHPMLREHILAEAKPF
ncbi:nucleotidyltransferase family protein [Effusibacillus pohliae]|uniref:nucleotidyltransferase family protein n=1 Tax=Effusibacillus pohliae TaxID=232270 RepID=UPI001FE1E3EC|nr:nucleotidyltransferase family protein [Effusibacillus pohliae]